MSIQLLRWIIEKMLFIIVQIMNILNVIHHGGFAGQSDSIPRNSCDTNPFSCLCWHTVIGWDDYRCGSILFNLTFNATLWQRVVWHAD
jgi:hypothetical protein